MISLIQLWDGKETGSIKVAQEGLSMEFITQVLALENMPVEILKEATLRCQGLESNLELEHDILEELPPKNDPSHPNHHHELINSLLRLIL